MALESWPVARQIGLGGDPGAQHLFPLRQPRAAMATDLKTAPHARLLFPVAPLIDPNAAHFEPPRNLRRTIPAIQRPQHALAQILRIGLHLRLPSTSGRIIA